jgi:60 kDa SS-A/Ro ribonucleoprotein
MPKVLALLSNENAVKKSMVIPFQFVTAMEAIAGTSADTNAVKKALNAAMEHSLANVPSFDDETLIAVDVSGSMGGRPVKIAALFAAVLYKANNADVMLFDTSIRHMNLNPGDSLSTIASQIERAATGGGTSFHLIFEGAKKKYGRIIVLSDMQAWVTSGRPGGCYSSLPNEAHKAYKKKFSCNPKIYSFDLNGAGSMQFPEENVYALAGFSDSVLGLMKNLEQNPQELVDTIEKVTF